MKIKNVYISAFGGLENFNLDFSDGLNIFYGDNEDGKTTVMNFIKMVFYGSAARVSDIAKNPRKKYIPWSGKNAAGSITFEKDSREYKIEREFRSSNATDKVTLIELDSGKVISVSGSENLGLKFIGLSAEAFERCAFISQLGVPEDNAEAKSELNSKLANLAGTGEEDVSYNANITRLEKLKYSIISKSKRTGVYDKNVSLLEELNANLTQSRIAEEKRKELALKIANEKSSLALIKSEIAKLKALLSEAEANRSYDKLKDYITASDTVKSCRSKLTLTDGKIAGAAFIEKAQSLLSDIKSSEPIISQMETDIEALKTEIDELKEKTDSSALQKITAAEEKLLKLSEEKNKLGENISGCEKALGDIEIKRSEAENFKKKPLPFIIITVIGLLVSASGFFFTPDYLIGAGIAVAGIIGIFLSKPKTNIAKLSEEAAVVKEQLVDLKTAMAENTSQSEKVRIELGILKESEGNAGKLLFSKEEEFKRKSALLKESKDKYTASKEFLNSAFSGMKNADTVSGMEIILFAIKENVAKLEKAEIKFGMLKSDLNDISVEEAKEKLSEISKDNSVTMSLDEINERLEFKVNELNNLISNLALDEASERTDFKNITNPEELEKQIETLEAKIKEEEFIYKATETAIETLTDAFMGLRKNFGSVINKRASEIFSALTGNAYEEMTVSSEFDIAVSPSESFGSKEWQYLSAGTIDQAYFSLRLAVSEMLSADLKGLPLFLDDVFCQYDDIRNKKAMEFLKEYSKTNQVSLFTCHGSYSQFGELKKLKNS